MTSSIQMNSTVGRILDLLEEGYSVVGIVGQFNSNPLQLANASRNAGFENQFSFVRSVINQWNEE
jgi:hypothetical protein